MQYKRNNVRYTAWGFLAALLLFSSCNHENNPSIVTGSLKSHSDCKTLSAFTKSEPIPDSVTIIEYNYDNANGLLKLKHSNSGFNCCPGTLQSSASLSGDTIIVVESESASLCDCNCLYDLDIEIQGVVERQYYIRIIEPYAHENDAIVFQVNLDVNATGSFESVRHYYPWGVYSSL